MEEENNKLPFLDVLVERCEFSFLTSIYGKPFFGPSKCPVYFRFPWIGPASQSFAKKVASSVYRCYAINVRSIFTTKTAFNSIHKDVLPIFKQSLLI